MNDKKIKKLVLSSVFAAIVCVATAVFSFPLAGRGYANLGDCFVIISGGLIGSWWGFAAAAVGSALADIILGYAVYAPATFVIKGIMALAVFYIAAKSGKISVIKTAFAAIIAEIIMIAGYFLFELAVFGAGVAIPDVLGNTTQGVVGAVTGAVLLTVFLKNKKLYSFFE